MTWSLMGKYPAILEHEEVGEEAKRLFMMPMPYLIK